MVWGTGDVARERAMVAGGARMKVTGYTHGTEKVDGLFVHLLLVLQDASMGVGEAREGRGVIQNH